MVDWLTDLYINICLPPTINCHNCRNNSYFEWSQMRCDNTYRMTLVSYGNSSILNQLKKRMCLPVQLYINCTPYTSVTRNSEPSGGNCLELFNLIKYPPTPFFDQVKFVFPIIDYYLDFGILVKYMVSWFKSLFSLFPPNSSTCMTSVKINKNEKT